MTQEEKELVLKDLCARLPYGVLCKTDDGVLPLKDVYINGAVGNEGQLKLDKFKYGGIYQSLDKVKPYLRPMSSMTEEEEKEFKAFHCVDGWHPEFYQAMCNLPNINNMINWLDKKMFDHRGLIPMGLALEAPEDMYKF